MIAATALLLALPATALGGSFTPSPIPSYPPDGPWPGYTPPVVPGFNTDHYPDSDSCQLALNAAINALSDEIYNIPASSNATQQAAAQAIDAAIKANIAALSALRPDCLAKVPGSGGGGTAAPPTGTSLALPVPAAGVRRTSCGNVRRKNGPKVPVVTLKGSSCKAARRAARALLAGKRPKGYSCVASRPKSWLKNPKRRNKVLWICARGGIRSTTPPTTPAAPPVVSLLPRGGVRCQSIVVNGRTYDVWKDKVLCGFARNTARRMITGETPYVYEFTNPSQGFFGRWVCEFFGVTAGTCIKKVEGRFVFWMLRR